MSYCCLMNLTEKMMRAALERLNEKLHLPIQLIIGGGGAMVLAHHFPLVTSDIDGIPKGVDVIELDPLIKEVGKELEISPDWLNPYFSTFTHVLPHDYGNRLEKVLSLKNLEVLALSKEDLLIMKCFAGRQKDVPHAKALIKKGINLQLVENQLEYLKKRNIPGTEKALDFLDDVLDQM